MFGDHLTECTFVVVLRKEVVTSMVGRYETKTSSIVRRS